MSTTFVDCFLLIFLAAIFSAIFLGLFVDLFLSIFFEGICLCPSSLGAVGFCFGSFSLPFGFVFPILFLKNEFQRGATTWVTSSLNLEPTNPPTGSENYELYALSPPRGLCLRPLQALPHPPCFALVEPFLWLCGGRVLGTSCLLDPT